MAEIVRVRFLSKNSPYQANETAGFPPAVAEAYVDQGVAEYADKPVEESEKSIDDMTVKELRNFAELHQIDISGLEKKADILEIIQMWVEEQDEPPKDLDDSGDLQ